MHFPHVYVNESIRSVPKLSALARACPAYGGVVREPSPLKVPYRIGGDVGIDLNYRLRRTGQVYRPLRPHVKYEVLEKLILGSYVGKWTRWPSERMSRKVIVNAPSFFTSIEP